VYLEEYYQMDYWKKGLYQIVKVVKGRVIKEFAPLSFQMCLQYTRQLQARGQVVMYSPGVELVLELEPSASGGK